MRSRLTLGVAGLLFVGAIIAGYQGLKLSQASAPATPPALPQVTPQVAAPPALDANLPAEPMPAEPAPMLPQEIRSPVVVLAAELVPGVPITLEHLRIEQLLIAPPHSFSTPDAVLGKQVSYALGAGAILTPHSFDNSGPLARMIGPDERALAIAVDEVVAAGGFIRPGDYVDVLLYLRENQQLEQQMAQVVIPALRVLSIGSELGLTAQGELIAPSASEADRARAQSRGATTAVLAVPKGLVSRFMLAAEAGKLRLAVRSAEEALLSDYYAHGLSQQGLNQQQEQELARQLLKFEALALSQAAPTPVNRPPRRTPAASAARSPSISVYRGSAVSQQTP